MRGEDLIIQNKYKTNSHPKASHFRISTEDGLVWHSSSGLKCCFHSGVRTFMWSYFIGLFIGFTVFVHAPHRTDKSLLWICAAELNVTSMALIFFFLILIYATKVINLHCYKVLKQKCTFSFQSWINIYWFGAYSVCTYLFFPSLCVEGCMCTHTCS